MYLGAGDYQDATKEVGMASRRNAHRNAHPVAHRDQESDERPLADEAEQSNELSQSGEISKSQRKRDHLELQDLGRALCEMPEADLVRLVERPNLLEAVRTGRRLRRAPLNRQVRYIARLLAGTDVEPIRIHLGQNEQANRAAIGRHHTVERWRDRFLSDGDGALRDFVDEYPQTDVQALRTLLRNALREKKAEKAPRYQRDLFRMLRNSMNPAQD